MGTEILQFDDYELDRGAYQLRRAGRVVHLQRIPLDLLCLLVEKRGQLIQRQEIIERIWGKGVFLDADNSINGAIRKLRRALNDNAGQSRFIAAVHGKGYRFVAQVHETGAGLAHLRPMRSSLVGRQREMDELRAGLAEAAAGRGGLFMVSGGPGIGKTRLTEELTALAQASRIAVFTGHCSERVEAIPFLPFVEILESCVDGATGADALRVLLGQEGPELGRLLPKLGRILPDLAAPLELTPTQARRHLLNCLCAFLTRITENQPTLMILEDLHWADDFTLAMLGHLAQRLAKLPVLVAGTYRDVELDVTGDLARTLEDLIRSRLAIAIRLKELGREGVAQMLSGLSGQAPPAAVVSEFYEETKGNPFFVEELFRHLAEENRLYDSEGSFRAEIRIAELEVPQSVRLVVGRRLTRLSESVQRLLEIAAVIGRSFTLKVLKATTLDERLAERVEEAERAGLILSDPESAQFEFSHELVRQAVMSVLPSARRQHLHLAVATALERTYANTLEDHYTELTHHNIRGGEVQRALHYLELAAIQRFALGAFEQALTLARTALDLLESQPEGLERTRQQMRWQRSFSLPLVISRGHQGEEALTAFRRLAELARRVGNSVEQMEAFKHIGFHHKTRGELGKAREASEEHLALAQRTGHRFQEASARQDLGEILHYLGELSLARDNIERVEAYCESASVASNKRVSDYTSFKPWNLAARNYIAPLLDWYFGLPDRARKRSEEVVVTAQEVDLTMFADALRHAGQVRVLCGEPQAIRRHMDRLVEVTKQYDLKPTFLVFANRLRASALLLSGQVQDAIAILRDCHTPPIYTAGAQINLASALVSAGEAREALAVADGALASLGEFRILEAEAHRVRGEALLAQAKPRWEEAERCLRAAIETARRQGAKSWELRAATGLARLLARKDRCDEGRTLLAEIYNWFTEGFNTADLREAKALLDRLNS